jgi:cell shape-determining protein MreD
MTRKDISLLIICTLLALPVLLIQYVYLGGARGPDLLIVLACAAGWMTPWPVSGFMGFAVGLLQDVLAGRMLGFSALSLSVASMSMSWMRGFLNPGMIFSPGIAAMVSACISDCASYVTLWSLRTPINRDFFLRDILPSTAAWAFVMIVPFCLIISGLLSLLLKLWPDSGKEKAGRIGYESRL